MSDFAGAIPHHDLFAHINLVDEADRVPFASRQDHRTEPRPKGMRAFSWNASWRNRRGGGISNGPPPFYFQGNMRVRDPESKFPKPWSWFDPDHLDGELGFLHVRGSDDAWRRFSDIAGASWRDLLRARLEPSVRDMVVRCELVEFTGDDRADARRWVMFIFLVAWCGEGPSSLRADRWRWIPGTGSRVEASIPDPAALMRDPDHAESRAFAGIADEMLPKSWRHFEADLSPNLFSASAEVLDWLESRLEVEPQRTNATPIDRGPSAPPSAPGTGEPSGTSPLAKPPKAPSNSAFRAWVLVVPLGMKQEPAAARLGKELKRSVSQGQVSRWVDKVKRYMDRGGVLPAELNPQKSAELRPAEPIDPTRIELGQNQDHRTKHLRGRGGLSGRGEETSE